MKLRSLSAVLLSLLLPVSATAQVEVAPVAPASLGGTHNVHRAGNLWFSGQFRPEDVATIAKSGVRRVVTLRTDGELEWDPAAAVRAAGLEFVAVPFRAPASLTDEVFDRVRDLLGDDAGATLLQCGSANRVGGVWLPWRVLDQGVPLEQALAEAKTIGLRSQGYQDRAVAYIERRRAATREPSAKEGINDDYLDPELDVQVWVDRFEVESREVYAARHAVLDALSLKPGMRVADVGSGTGLYTFLLSESVGADGWVWAVDISPRMLEHVLELASARNVANVTGVLCPEDSVALPPASIDLAWVCDTYHHFEYPKATLASLFRAIAPGGRLVVLDFERIPGVTRQWLLDHVRAGKDVFRAEIEAAGFTFVRELEVEGIEENYVLEFVRPSDG